MRTDEAIMYRSGVANVNSLSPDSVDLGYVSKELARSMANPREGDMMKQNRVARYLKIHPAWIVRFEYQDPTVEEVAFSHIDWGDSVLFFVCCIFVCHQVCVVL